MAGETSERKEFAASRRKLRKMREQGQFAQSRDLSTFIVTFAGTLYLIIAAPFAVERLMATIDKAFIAIDPRYSGDAPLFVLLDLWQVLLVSLPLFLAVMFSGLAAGGLIGGGIQLSPEAMMPKLERISPVSGFKRLFGRQALMQFLLSIIKVTVFVGLIIGFFAYAFKYFTRLGTTMDAAILMLVQGLGIMVGILLLLMMVVGIIDYLIQRAIFLDEAKMTRTERKQETKNDEGEPTQRSRRKQIAREDLDNPTGIRQATFAVQKGPILVAYRWIEGKTPVPILVAKTTSADGVKAFKENMTNRMPIIRDGLAAQLVRTPIGSPVLKTDIQALAQLMSRHGLY